MWRCHINTLQSEIIDYLIRKLIEHSLLPGERLPSEVELSQRFKTTRINVRRAFERMVDMGYISEKQDKGYYVKTRHQPIELVLYGDQSFSAKMEQLGFAYESRTISCEALPFQEHLWREMGLEHHHKAYKISRVRIIDGDPIALHMSFVSNKTFPNIEVEGGAIKSMFCYFKEKGYESLSTTGSRISIAFPTLHEQSHLKCHGLVPLLLVETNCVDKETGKLLEITKIIYKSDRFKYKLT